MRGAVGLALLVLTAPLLASPASASAVVAHGTIYVAFHGMVDVPENALDHFDLVPTRGAILHPVVTNDAAHVGAYFLMIRFYDASGARIQECRSLSAPEPFCLVPTGATLARVTAAYGANLEVDVQSSL